MQSKVTESNAIGLVKKEHSRVTELENQIERLEAKLSKRSSVVEINGTGPDLDSDIDSNIDSDNDSSIRAEFSAVKTLETASETEISELLIPKNEQSATLKITPPLKRKITLPRPANFEKWHRKECTPVYFLGGGKCGSTTLAMLLKHDPPGYENPRPVETNQFASAGKEVCWVERINDPDIYWKRFEGCEIHETKNSTKNGQIRQLFALDACPRTYSTAHAKKIAAVHPNAKFIMPVRDPVTRKISHLNDQMIRSHGSKDIEKGTKTKTSRSTSELSKFGKILGSFLEYFDSDQFLIVRNEALSENVQDIVDDVMEFLGGERQVVTWCE